MASDDLFGGPLAAGSEGVEAGAPGDAGAPTSDASLAVVAVSGRNVPFDPERLAASVERARVAGGGAERRTLGDEVADVVRLTLRARAEQGGGRVVQLEGLGELVERALVELGAVDTARAYMVGRDRRRRSEGLRRGDVGAAAGGLPLVRGASGPEPFRARRVVAALVEEAGLLPDDAEGVAERVVETLRAGALRSVSTGLVRELVSNELAALGRADALRRHEAIGVPRHDLGRLFEGACAAGPDARLARPWSGHGASDFGARAGAALLRRWALEDGLETAQADGHRSADLHVIGLGTPDRVLARSASARLLAGGAGVGGLAAAAAEAARGTAFGLVLDAPDRVEGARSPAGAEALLAGLAAAAAGAGVPVDLALTGRPEGEEGQARAALIGAAARGGRGPAAPRLFADLAGLRATLEGLGPDDAERLADHVEELLGREALIPVWCDHEGGRWAGPGLVRRGGRGAGADAPLALDAAVALNLPRLARRAGPWREEEFLAGLMRLVDLALDALSGRLVFLARCRRAHGEPLCDRPAGALVPVGLHEALRILGDGLARAELGARVLGFLGDAAARGGAARSMDARVTTLLGERAAARFTAADAGAGGARQPRLFGDLPVPEDELSRTYRVVPGDLAAAAPGELARLRPRAEALAALLGTSPSGALMAARGAAGRSDQGADQGAGQGAGQGGAAPPPAPGPADAGTPPRGESGAGGRGLLAASLLEERPRTAAWCRFEALRRRREPARSAPVETTLF